MSLTIESSFLWNETVWNPRMVTGLSLWLDAADTSTVFSDAGVTQATSGSTVQQWNDKSGFGRNATQSTAGSRPSLTTSSLNGLQGVAFNSKRLSIASSSVFPSGSSDFSFVALYRPTFASGYGTLFANYVSGNFQLLVGSSPDSWQPWGIYLAANIDISPDAYTQDSNNIISAVKSSNIVTGWTNGNQNNSVANTNSVYTPSGTESVWSIGANTGGGEAFQGIIYEFICVKSALSIQDRQKLEGYLAHKWGLEANLPAGHPYKNYGPKP